MNELNNTIVRIYEVINENKDLKWYQIIKRIKNNSRLTDLQNELLESNVFNFGDAAYTFFRGCDNTDEIKNIDIIGSFIVISFGDFTIDYDAKKHIYCVHDNKNLIDYTVYKNKELPKVVKDLWEPLTNNIRFFYTGKIIKLINIIVNRSRGK